MNNLPSVVNVFLSVIGVANNKSHEVLAVNSCRREINFTGFVDFFCDYSVGFVRTLKTEKQTKNYSAWFQWLSITAASHISQVYCFVIGINYSDLLSIAKQDHKYQKAILCEDAMIIQ